MDEIFLSYAKEDKIEVDKIYVKLIECGLKPWMDSPPSPYTINGIPFGEKWDVFLESKLNSADLILIFLSGKSIVKKGYVQKEYRLALSKSMYHPASSIPLIPILLEDVEVPDLKVDSISLKDFQWYSLPQLGIDPLIDILKRRFTKISLSSSELQIQELKEKVLDLELKTLIMAKIIDKQRDKFADERNEYIDRISDLSDDTGRRFFRE